MTLPLQVATIALQFTNDFPLTINMPLPLGYVPLGYRQMFRNHRLVHDCHL
jgi:hypothetical protein